MPQLNHYSEIKVLLTTCFSILEDNAEDNAKEKHRSKIIEFRKKLVSFLENYQAAGNGDKEIATILDTVLDYGLLTNVRAVKKVFKHKLTQLEAFHIYFCIRVIKDYLQNEGQTKHPYISNLKDQIAQYSLTTFPLKKMLAGKLYFIEKYLSMDERDTFKLLSTIERNSYEIISTKTDASEGEDKKSKEKDKKSKEEVEKEKEQLIQRSEEFNKKVQPYVNEILENKNDIQQYLQTRQREFENLLNPNANDSPPKEPVVLQTGDKLKHIKTDDAAADDQNNKSETEMENAFDNTQFITTIEENYSSDSNGNSNQYAGDQNLDLYLSSNASTSLSSSLSDISSVSAEKSITNKSTDDFIMIDNTENESSNSTALNENTMQLVLYKNHGRDPFIDDYIKKYENTNSLAPAESQDDISLSSQGIFSSLFYPAQVIVQSISDNAYLVGSSIYNYWYPSSTDENIGQQKNIELQDGDKLSSDSTASHSKSDIAADDNKKMSEKAVENTNMGNIIANTESVNIKENEAATNPVLTTSSSSSLTDNGLSPQSITNIPKVETIDDYTSNEKCVSINVGAVNQSMCKGTTQFSVFVGDKLSSDSTASRSKSDIKSVSADYMERNPLLFTKSASQSSIISNDVQSTNKGGNLNLTNKDGNKQELSVNFYWCAAFLLLGGIGGGIGTGLITNNILQSLLVGFGVGFFLLNIYLVCTLLQKVTKNSSNNNPPLYRIVALFLFLGAGGLTGLIAGQLTNGHFFNNMLTGSGLGLSLLLTICLLYAINKVGNTATSCLNETKATVTEDDKQSTEENLPSAQFSLTSTE